MKKEYCPYCDNYEFYEVHKEKRTYNIRGANKTVKVKIARCKHCGKEIYVEKIEKHNDIAIYGLWYVLKQKLRKNNGRNRRIKKNR